MEEERIIRSRVFDQPVHRTKYVLLRRLTHRILLVISQDDHIFPLVVEIVIEIRRHVPNIIDTASQLSPLTKVVDSNQKGLAFAIARGILKRVFRRRSATELLHALGRRRRGIRVAMHIGVRVHGRHSYTLSDIILKVCSIELTRSSIVLRRRHSLRPWWSITVPWPWGWRSLSM